MRSPCGFHHRFVFGAIFVWLEKNLVQLLAHRRRALALGQFFGPGADLGDQEFFLFNAGQRQLQNLGGCLFEAAFTGAPEIMRRLKQPEQSSRLLLQAGGLAGVGAEVVARQVGKTELLVAGKFPGQVQVNLQAQQLAARQQFCRRRFFKFQQGVGRFDLDPLARVEFNLHRSVGLGQDAAGQKLAGFFKQCVHEPNCPMGLPARRAASGQRKKAQNARQVRVKVAQGVVTALEKQALRACVAGAHFAPVQQLITFGDQGVKTFRATQRAGIKIAQLLHEFGLEKESFLR